MISRLWDGALSGPPIPSHLTPYNHKADPSQWAQEAAGVSLRHKIPLLGDNEGETAGCLIKSTRLRP